MSGNDLIEQDLKTILATEDGNYVAEYEAVVASFDKEAVQATRTSRDERKERWKKALAKLDRKELASANKTFSGFMRLLRRDSAIINVEDPGPLSPTEAENLMETMLNLQKLEEILKAVREERKVRVLAAMTAQFAAEGEEYPDQINASIDVPSMGHRFAREGCGRKEPELDEDKLAAALGPALWSRVSVEEVIPAQVIRKLDLKALMQEARRDPAVLEHLRTSLKVGEWKSPRFNIRAI